MSTVINDAPPVEAEEASQVVEQAESEPKRFTPDDLLAMDDAVGFELVNGQLVERAVSTESSAIGVRIARMLDTVVEEHELGLVVGADCSFQCFEDVLPDRNRIRKPDVAFIAAGRLTEELYQAGHTPIAPDLAVEVISPNDNATELNSKIEEYLLAGVQLVWVVYPASRTVDVFRPGANASHLHEADELSGEEVIPGFQCEVAKLFPKVKATPQVEGQK
jgi:Uma2 family endonuclease